MREYFEPMLGTTGALIAQFAITLVVVLALILIVFWFIRRFSGGRFGAGANRSRQPRLSVLDALPIDQRRRLVLVRRDNVEHLLLIGGPSDVVVEAAIHRAPPAQRRAEAAPARPAPAPRTEPARPPVEAQRPAAEARRPEPVVPPSEPAPEPFETVQRRPEPVLRAEPMITPSQAEPEEPPLAADLPEPPVAQPAPQPPKGSRGVQGFLSSVRSRPAPTAESGLSRRGEPRGRVIEPPRASQRGGPSPFAVRHVEPESAEAETPPAEPEPFRTAPTVRPAVPPAPPVETPTFRDEPYGAPESGHSLRFEPIFDVEEIPPEPDLGKSHGASADTVLVPEVEPPQRSDEPPLIDEAFGDDVSVLDVGRTGESDEPEPKSRASQVGDLEKEMARLLGEISGTKR